VLASVSSSVAAVAFPALYFMLGLLASISRQRSPDIGLRFGELALFPADVSFVTFVWLNKRAGHVTSLNSSIQKGQREMSEQCSESPIFRAACIKPSHRVYARQSRSRIC
jgi:hypothetical protein